jgi:hypothetical protein
MSVFLVLALPALAPAQSDATQQTPLPPTTTDASTLSESLTASDAMEWETLADTLFISGERGVADPGRVEPLPRQMFRLGPVSLLPKWDEEVMYDSNVFLTDDDEQDDFILRSRVALLADWQMASSGHRISAGYDMLRNWFMGGEAKSFVEQLASAQVELNFKHVRATVGDRYEDRTDPILAVFTQKVERRLNTVYGTLGWYDDSTYVETKAQDVDTKYDDFNFEQFDRDEGYAHVEYGWRQQDELWLFARAGVVDRKFDENQLNDMFGETLSVGARWSKSPEVDASLRVGVKIEQFDDDVATDGEDSAVNPDVEARAIWWPVRRDGVDLRYVHTTEFSPVSNYEVLDRVELGWTRLLSGRIRSRAGFGVERVNPSSLADTFVRYSVGAGLAWRVLEFVDVTANWRLRIRATSTPNGDYTDNQVSVGFAVRL